MKINVAIMDKASFSRLLSFFAAFFLFIASCDSGGGGSTIPIDLGEVKAEFLADIAYGSDPLQKFDIFMPESETPTALVIHIHGGAFYTGDKDSEYNLDDISDTIRGLLEQGIAVANINYRLLNPFVGDDVGAMKSIGDGQYCLQYIRHNAVEYNIDKERISLMGISAGAGISLWVGLQDEMAEGGSEDLVLRESTRVSAIAAIETQATYDLVQWDDIFSDFSITLQGFVSEPGNIAMYYLVCAFYAMEVSDPENLNAQLALQAVVDYRADLDMLALMDSSDPELFLSNRMIPAEPASIGINEIFHHPLHAKTLMDKANEAGIEIPNETYLSMSATGAMDELGDGLLDDALVDFMDGILNPQP